MSTKPSPIDVMNLASEAATKQRQWKAWVKAYEIRRDKETIIDSAVGALRDVGLHSDGERILKLRWSSGFCPRSGNGEHERSPLNHCYLCGEKLEGET